MISDEALADFEASNMGWLTDEGDLLACRLHGHMERLASIPRFEPAYRRYKGTCEANRAAMEADLAELGPDEHPGMHRFDGMDDDAKAELVKTVYEAGWIRLGRALDIRDLRAASLRNGGSIRAALDADRSWYVEAEGLTEPVRGRIGVLEHIAARLGCRLVRREMRYASVNVGSTRRPRVRALLVPESSDPSQAPRRGAPA